MTNEPAMEIQKAAGRDLPLGNLNGSDAENDEASQQFDEMTLAAAKAAKEYRSWMLEQMKASINTGLDHANRLDAASSLTVVEGTGQRSRAQENSTIPESESELPAAAKTAEEYRIKAIELINANVNATLDYAQQLAAVTSPAEFLALSTSHARKHFELMMTHAAAFAWWM